MQSKLWWRIFAALALLIGGLSFSSPAQAAPDGNTVVRAADVQAKGDMLQRGENFLDTTLSLPRRLECRGFRDDRSVSVSADRVSVNWSCERGHERMWAEVGRRQVDMRQGDVLVLQNGRACVKSRWFCGPRDWFPSWERPQRVHTFVLSTDNWRGPNRLQVDVPTTGLLNRWTAFNATQTGNVLTLGGRGGWPVQH